MADLGTDLATPSDADGLPDLDPYFRTVTGAEGLAQALLRRLVTPRGSLIDDAAYGFDLRLRINGNLRPGDLGHLAALIEAELLADERVSRTQASVTEEASGLSVAALVVSSAGPFRMVLAVSAVSASLVSVESL